MSIADFDGLVRHDRNGSLETREIVKRFGDQAEPHDQRGLAADDPAAEPERQAADQQCAEKGTDQRATAMRKKSQRVQVWEGHVRRGGSRSSRLIRHAGIGFCLHRECFERVQDQLPISVSNPCGEEALTV